MTGRDDQATYHVVVSSKAPRERVFALLSDATTWSAWCKPMIPRSEWETEGSPAPGGVGAVRRLGAPGFWTREQILDYDAPSHLAYTIVSRQPIRDYRSDVTLTEDAGVTTIEWRGVLRPVVPGTGRAFAWLLQRVVGFMARRLAAYAEREAAA